MRLQSSDVQDNKNKYIIVNAVFFLRSLYIV